MELVGETVCVSGFLASGNSKHAAQKDALDCIEKGKSAVCLHIFLRQDSAHLKLDNPMYTPYHRTEQHTLMQDGVKLVLDSVNKEKMKEKVKGKNPTLVTLKLRSQGQ